MTPTSPTSNFMKNPSWVFGNSAVIFAELQTFLKPLKRALFGQKSLKIVYSFNDKILKSLKTGVHEPKMRKIMVFMVNVCGNPEVGLLPWKTLVLDPSTL